MIFEHKSKVIFITKSNSAQKGMLELNLELKLKDNEINFICQEE